MYQLGGLDVPAGVTVPKYATRLDFNSRTSKDAKV